MSNLRERKKVVSKYGNETNNFEKIPLDTIEKKYSKNEDNVYPISPEYRTVSPVRLVEIFFQIFLTSDYGLPKYHEKMLCS